jgi:hypothetical protein
MSAHLTKNEVQARALGVVVSWLRSEAHFDVEDLPNVTSAKSDRVLKWAQEAQDRLACFVDLEIAKLRFKP